MTLSFHTPVIFVKDIKRSKRFYIDLLGQEIEQDFGRYVMFKSKLSLWEIIPGSEIAEIEGKSSEGNTFELYFDTEDVYGSMDQLKNEKLRSLHDLKTEPWGQKTFRFFDPDDHLIEVGESINTFIQRIYSETSSITSVAEKTGISEDEIRNILKL